MSIPNVLSHIYGLVPVSIGVVCRSGISASELAKVVGAAASALCEIAELSANSPHVLLTALHDEGEIAIAELAHDSGWMLGVVLPASFEVCAASLPDPALCSRFKGLLKRAAWVHHLPASFKDKDSCLAAGMYVARHSFYLIACRAEGTIEGDCVDTIVDCFLHGIPEVEKLPGASDNYLLEARPVWEITAHGDQKMREPVPELAAKFGSEHEKLERWLNILSKIDLFNLDATRHLKERGAEVSQYLVKHLDNSFDARGPKAIVIPGMLFATADAISITSQLERKRLLYILVGASSTAILLEGIYSWLTSHPWILVFSIAAAAAAWALYFFGENKRLEERYLDYRALAEACRVQYFWKRAGLKYSASDHHLRDQSDELEWIRRAVRSTEMIRDGMASSEAGMRAVGECWLCGQQSYFTGNDEQYGKAGENERNDLKWSARANYLFIAGIVIMLLLAAAQFWMGDEMDEDIIQVTGLAYGLMFAFAGVIKVYQEIEAFSEQSKRYSRMGIAMAVARKRLNTALSKSDLAEAENVLLGAGRDALEENGGWLLLRRDRPVKPM